MFSFDQYKDYVDRVDDPHGNKRYILLGDDLKKYCDDLEKTPIDFTPRELSNFLLSRGITHPTTVSRHITMFRQLYEILKDDGVRFDNPCESELLNINYIIINTKADVPFYSSADIDRIIQKIDCNKAFYEGIIRTFYEGVAENSTEIWQLNRSDIDFSNRTVNTKRGSKVISERLFEAYKEVLTISDLQDPHPRSKDGFRQTSCRRDFYGAVFPISTKSPATFYLNRFRKVSEMGGCEITPHHLYYCGFLDYAGKKIGVEKLLELMLDYRRNTKVDTRVIEGLIEEYRFAIPITKIKYQLRAYTLAMKYSLADS